MTSKIPPMPPKAPKQKKPRKKKTARIDTEAYIKLQCLCIANMIPGVFVWRQGCYEGKILGGRYINTGMKGCSDIVGIINGPDNVGRHLAIEIKRRHGGIQSKAQQDFQANIESHHGLYILVHSAEELVRYLCLHQREGVTPYMSRLSHLHTQQLRKHSGMGFWFVLLLVASVSAAMLIHSLITPIIVNLLK